MKATWTASFAAHTTEWIVGIVTLATLIFVVTLRSATNKNVEITLNDAIIAAIAGGLALLISGKIAKLIIGAEGVTIETTKQAIITSTNTKITKQVLPIQVVSEAEKGALEELPNFVGRRVQALDFTLGRRYYQADVIKKYLETLTSYDFFRYVILNNPNGTLFGMIDASSLKANLNNPIALESFSDQVNSNTNLDRIVQLPGFVSARDAVSEGDDRRVVLDRMEKIGRDWLPVVDPGGRFKGIVDQSRLTASIILDVTNQLRAASDQGAPD
jgi:hypothetical protein